VEDASSDRLSEVVSPKAALEPAVQPKLTAKQIGQLRRQYVTIVHGHVTACKHRARFSATQQPKGNCVACWQAYFYTCVDLEGIHIVLTKQGVKALEKQRGRKFVRAFHGFLSQCLLPKLNAEAEQLVPADPTVIEGSSIV
jgi:hypothetical protein